MNLDAKAVDAVITAAWNQVAEIQKDSNELFVALEEDPNHPDVALDRIAARELYAKTNGQVAGIAGLLKQLGLDSVGNAIWADMTPGLDQMRFAYQLEEEQ